MTPEGRRRRGWPKETWRITVERERGELGFKGWTEAGSFAKDRKACRERTQRLISLKDKMIMMMMMMMMMIKVHDSFVRCGNCE